MCWAAGCGEQVGPKGGKGLCVPHLHRLNRYGDPLAGGARRNRQGPECTVGGCDSPSKARGLCDKHYYRWNKYGDPLVLNTTWRNASPAVDRFWSFVSFPDGVLSHWLWTGPVDAYGYGYLELGEGKSQTVPAHRFSFDLFKGPIPDGLVVDHRCRIHPCVNPFDLRLLTRGSNADSNRIKTHCPNDHPYAGENLYIGPSGDRRCRACARKRYHDRKARA